MGTKRSKKRATNRINSPLGFPRLPKWWRAPKEIIVKFGYFIDGTTRTCRPVFELILLADVAGFRFLSRYFAERARACQAMRRRIYYMDEPDPDDHQHLGGWSRWDEFNARLSDNMEFRIGSLTKANRKATFGKYGISLAKRRAGSMAPHLRALAKEAEAQIRKEARLMKRAAKSRLVSAARRARGTSKPA